MDQLHSHPAPQQQQLTADEATIVVDLSGIVSNELTTLDSKPSPMILPPPAVSLSAAILSVLTGFHAGYFRIPLSLSAQALLWKTLITSTADATETSSAAIAIARRAIPSAAFVLLWSLALATAVALSFLYALRCILRPRAVRAEFAHPVAVNYLFAPWVSYLFLIESSPFSIPLSTRLPFLPSLFFMLLALPVFALDVKLYGQWFTTSGGAGGTAPNQPQHKGTPPPLFSRRQRRFLSVVANPASQMSVIANMACARAAARLGYAEPALLLFSVGFSHYLVLFVTLYQRFAGSDRLTPVPLRPVFFLFFAAPSMASLAWREISGGFDVGSRMLFFLSLFLLASLVSRPSLFRKSMNKFTVAWWAYSFPLTAVAMASSEYARELNESPVANALMLSLTALSVLVALLLMVYTALNTGAFLPPAPLEVEFTPRSTSNKIVAMPGVSPEGSTTSTGDATASVVLHIGS